MPTLKEIEQRLNTNMPGVLSKNSKYAPKLNFASRCSAFAALKMGVYTRLIAATFGVNRATLSYMTRPNSPHYQDVRKEYFELGHERFVEQYLTTEVLERLERHKNDPELKLSIDEVREINSASANVANPKANKFAGRHSIHDPFAGMLLVEVVYTDNPGPSPDGMQDERGPGWYITIDPSSAGYKAGNWQPGFQGLNESAKTSKAQLDWLLSSIGGELQ